MGRTALLEEWRSGKTESTTDRLDKGRVRVLELKFRGEDHKAQGTGEKEQENRCGQTHFEHSGENRRNPFGRELVGEFEGGLAREFPRGVGHFYDWRERRTEGQAKQGEEKSMGGGVATPTCSRG